MLLQKKRMEVLQKKRGNDYSFLELNEARHSKKQQKGKKKGVEEGGKSHNPRVLTALLAMSSAKEKNQKLF